MKLAILSDIHGNYMALDECLKYIDNNDFDGIVFLGDYITDCPYPDKTISLVRQTMTKHKSWAVRGNREDYMINYEKSNSGTWNYSSATGALLYTFENLSEDSLNFIKSLAIGDVVNIPNCKPLYICHATMENNKDLLRPNTDFTNSYMKSFIGEYLLVGHTHRPFTYRIHDKTLINVGSVGCPTNFQTKSQFVALEFIGDEWIDTLVSVEYDIDILISDFYSSSILEKSKMWGLSMIKLLKTGTNYPMKVLVKAEAVSSKAPSPVTSPVLLPSFRVRVVDADKKPLKNAIVYIESTGDDLWSGDRITDNLGEFRLGNIPEEKLKSGKYKLRVNCPVDGIDEELTISITTDKVKEDYVITLNSKIKPVDSNTDKGLKLTVRNSSGSVVRNIKVNLQQLNVIPQTNGMSEDHSIGASFAPAGFTDDNGVVYFPNAKGEYRVTYSWKTGSHRLEESVVLNKTGITEKTLDFDETLLYP